jgi:hypothetical protein
MPMSLIDARRGGDAAFPRGRRHHWRAGFLDRLGPDAIDVLVHLQGAAARVPPTATAFAHRHDRWDGSMLTQWDRPADDDRNIRWTRGLYVRIEPHPEHAVYVNDLGGDESDRVRAAYGPSDDRLVTIEATYDPGSFFRWKQTVTAAA